MQRNFIEHKGGKDGEFWKYINKLEGTARYAGLLLAPAEGFGLRPRPLWPLAKAYMAFSQ